MVSLWVYANSEGISSAREIERLMEWEPGMQWLGGLQTVNHHSLSYFRIEHRAALDELFAQLLALLAQAGSAAATRKARSQRWRKWRRIWGRNRRRR